MSDTTKSGLPWNVLLPIKVLSKGKSRFKALSNDERIALIRAMANDVLDVLLLVPAVNLITIVGIDHHRLGDRADTRIQSIVPEPTTGINEDILAVPRVNIRSAVLLPDLPSLNCDEVALALTLAASHKQSFISDQSGLGTTMYLSTRSEWFHPCFGAKSAIHYAENGAVELASPLFKGIRRDCDDLADLLGIPPASLGNATKSLVDQWKHH